MWQTYEIESVLPTMTYSALPEQASRQGSLSDRSSLKLTLEEQQELDVLKAWAEVLPSNDHDYQARSIYYNFLAQMRKEADRQSRSPRSFSYDERLQFLQDPYVDTVLSLLPRTKHFQMNTLATILLDKVAEAILRELQRGMEMEIITNGQTAHAYYLTAPGWFAGIHKRLATPVRQWFESFFEILYSKRPKK